MVIFPNDSSHFSFTKISIYISGSLSLERITHNITKGIISGFGKSLAYVIKWSFVYFSRIVFRFQQKSDGSVLVGEVEHKVFAWTGLIIFSNQMKDLGLRD